MSQTLRDTLISGSHALYPYLVANVTVHYSTTGNKIAVKGVGNYGAATKIINTSNPITRKELRFQFIRLNAVPDIPYIQSIYKDNENDVVEIADIQLGNPILHSDGKSQIYQAAGRVVFICQTVYDPATTTLTYPLSPVDANKAQMPYIIPSGPQNTDSFAGGGFNATFPFTPASGVNFSTNTATNSTKGPTDITG